MRQDKSYIGGEDIEIKLDDKKLQFEVWLFLPISILFIILFLTRVEFLKICFAAGKLNSILGSFIILILSPFGAHLITKVVVFFWEKLKCDTQNSGN